MATTSLVLVRISLGCSYIPCCPASLSSLLCNLHFAIFQAVYTQWELRLICTNLHLLPWITAEPRRGVWGASPYNPASLSASVQRTLWHVTVCGGSALQFCHYVSVSSHLHWFYCAFKCVLEENAQSVFLHADVCFCLMLVPEHLWAPCSNE